MKKTKLILTLAVVIAAMALSACGGSAAPATQAAPPVEQPQQQQPAPTAESQPVEQQQPAPTAQSFAPTCTSAASCAAPAVADTEASTTYCVEKYPYQNIALEPGTAFEVLDTSGEFKCADSGTVVDGKTIISCTGKQLWTYELKLTNTSCSAANLAAGTGQCQDGFGYDSAQNCCAPVNTGAASTTIKVNIGACP